MFMSLQNSTLDDLQQSDEVDKALQKIYELKRFIEINAKDFKFDGNIFLLIISTYKRDIQTRLGILMAG
jgi:hypothetical protein